MRDEFDDDRPSRRPRRRKQCRAQSGSGIWIALTILLIVLIAGGGVVVLWATGVFDKSSADPAGPKARERLVGSWDHTSPKDPSVGMSLDIRHDGRFLLTGTKSGKTLSIEPATWEVVTERQDRLTIKLTWDTRPTPSQWDIEFLPEDNLRVNILGANSPPVAYRRR